jgi:hypothetical protein
MQITDIRNRCVEDSDGCWIWQGAKASGYGRLRVKGVLYSAHRLAFMVTNPDVDITGLDICHKCDKRPCCNPSCLFAGTRSDNMMDCSRKGRLPKQCGKHYHAKHDQQYVPVIRRLKNLGLSKRAISKELGWAWSTYLRFERRHGV